MVKKSTCNAGDLGSVPGLGRSPGGGNGNSLQYSCLENAMNGGAWRATVHGFAESQTLLRGFHFSGEMCPTVECGACHMTCGILVSPTRN